MKKTYLEITGIPCVLWGEDTSRVVLAVHGKKSHKEDTVIELLANVVCPNGYQVMSFDLPKHGDRKKLPTECTFDQCMRDILSVYEYLQPKYDISLFAVSIGAFLSMHALADLKFTQALFLSPMVDMSHIVSKMMEWFNISEKDVLSNHVIMTPMGEEIFSSDYQFLKSNHHVSWNIPTSILYGQDDDISEFKDVYQFVQKHDCDFVMVEDGPHHFHTKEQLAVVEMWINEKIGAQA